MREFSMVNSSPSKVFELSLGWRRFDVWGALCPRGLRARGSRSNPSTGVRVLGVDVFSIEKQLAKSKHFVR